MPSWNGVRCVTNAGRKQAGVVDVIDQGMLDPVTDRYRVAEIESFLYVQVAIFKGAMQPVKCLVGTFNMLLGKVIGQSLIIPD